MNSTRQGPSFVEHVYGCGFRAYLQVQEPKLCIYMYFGPDNWAGVRIGGWWR
jgi:hypothetical protein